MNKIRRMEIFTAVVEAKKFTLAALNLGLSKSAVSHAISDLETYLGTQLINRNNREFQLTSDGETYYEQCSKFLSELNAIEDTYRREKSTIDGHISITAPISFGVSRLSPILTDFLQRNPKIDLSLSLSEDNVDLVHGGLDMAIRIGHLSSSSLKAKRLSGARMMLTASPQFIKAHPNLKSVKDLEAVNTLRYRWTPKWNFTKDGKPYSHSPKGNIVSDSGEALLKFTAGSQGVSFLPDFIVEDDLRNGTIRQILPEYEGEVFPVQAVFPANRHRSTRIKKLLDHLEAAFA